MAHVNGEKEVFFGSDRMELLAHVLGNNNIFQVTCNCPELCDSTSPNNAHGTGEKWDGPLVGSVKSQL